MRRKTAREVAAQFGVSTRTVYRATGEPRAEYLARAAERRAKVVELRRQGMTHRAIAATLGLPSGSISTLLKQAQQHGEWDGRTDLSTTPASAS